MEDIQPQPILRRSKHAVWSAGLALVSVLMVFFLPSEQGPVALYFYAAFLLAIVAVIFGWLGLVHIRHDATLGGRTYAYVGIGLALAEILFGLWSVGNANAA